MRGAGRGVIPGGESQKLSRINMVSRIILRYDRAMSSTATLTQTLGQAGVTLDAAATRSAQDIIDSWIADDQPVTATDILDQIADEMFYTDRTRAAALWDRVQAGEFDTYAPIWTAA